MFDHLIIINEKVGVSLDHAAESLNFISSCFNTLGDSLS